MVEYIQGKGLFLSLIRFQESKYISNDLVQKESKYISKYLVQKESKYISKYIQKERNVFSLIDKNPNIFKRNPSILYKRNPNIYPSILYKRDPSILYKRNPRVNYLFSLIRLQLSCTRENYPFSH